MESSGSSDKEIKIGATAGPHAEVVEAVAKEAEKQGIHSERTPAYRGGSTFTVLDESDERWSQYESGL